jgi:hypothetical protein
MEVWVAHEDSGAYSDYSRTILGVWAGPLEAVQAAVRAIAQAEIDDGRQLGPWQRGPAAADDEDAPAAEPSQDHWRMSLLGPGGAPPTWRDDPVDYYLTRWPVQVLG